MKTKKIKIWGVLRTGSDRQYYLVHPYPVKQHDWERDTERRWLVIPRNPHPDSGLTDNLVYFPARHIVSNNWTVEFGDLPEIDVMTLDNDIDLLLGDFYRTNPQYEE